MGRRTTPAETTCPSCGKTVTAIPIAYGYPAPSAFEEEEAGRLRIGGCVVTEDGPQWACPECHEPIFDDAQHERRYRRWLEPEGEL